MRKSVWIILAVMIVVVAAPNAQADTIIDLNVPGTGLIPVQSYVIDPSSCSSNCVILTRTVDSFSPFLFVTTVSGTPLPTASLETFDSSFSTTTPITSFVMTDLVITSIQHSGSSENPIETVAINFETGTLVNNVPEPSSLMLLGSGLLGLAFRRRRSC